MNTLLPPRSIAPLTSHFSRSEAILPTRGHPSWPRSWWALLVSLLVLSSSAPSVHAQGIPPGCTGSAIGISLFGSSADVHVGDTLFYSASVFNGIPGNPTSCDASNIVATITTPDGVIHPITLTRTYLRHTQSDFYSNVVSYVVRAQDIQPDGTVRATAEVTALIYQNDIPSTGGANQGVNTQVVQPCIKVAVQCVGGLGEFGAITYTGTVTNCGNDTLFGVTVTNSVNGGNFSVTLATNRLARGEVVSFSGSWIPTNSCGPSTATFVAQGRDLLTVAPQTVTSSASTTCQNALTSGIQVTKVCPGTPPRPGQLLTFSGSISNTGNVTLTNIVVVNNQPTNNTPVFTRSTLAPGAVVSFTGSYLAPTNCSVTDTLTATATSRCGVGVSSVASASCPILTTPQIAVTASCPTAPVTPGGLMVHNGTVRNLGDTTLNNVVVVRDFPVPNTAVFTLASLAPGASANFTSTLTVPSNACSVTTTFSGRGTDACAPNTVTNNFAIACQVTTAPAVVVTLTCPTTPTAPGGLITYTGTVRNSGNVSLNNVTVVDSQSVPSTVLTVASLAPGVTTNFSASFTAPVDTCSVSSTVTASGRDNCTGAVVNNSASATCALATTPRIVVTQTCPAGPSGLGGLLTYGGSVSNAGDITLTNVVVTNDRTGTNPVYTVATLAPGAKTNFTGSYTVPLNAGCAITSTLTANGRDKCNGTQVSATAAATCPVQGAPNIAVRLSCPAAPTPLGGVLTYSGSVSNSGNITLTNVVVRRDVPAPTTVVFTVASLAPGASASFSGSYTVPSSNACAITTSVNATANDQCAGSGVIATASISCPLVTAPAIRVTQTCPVDPVAPGGLLVYGGSVSNAGNITLTNITVVSSQPVPNTVVFNLASLSPGATAAFSGSFNAPLDACAAGSTLTAAGQSQCNGNLATNSVTTSCPLVTAPQIRVTKACPATPVIEGGLLVFTGTVTNTGNITLTNVIVVNNRPAANTTVLGPITLAPGAGTNFSGSYTAPLNACSVTDTLTATARNKCTGGSVTNTATTTCPITTIPRLAVTLVCPATPAATGGLITYTGTVRNSGNVTLNNVAVVNSQSVPSTVLTVASLAPGVTTNFTTSFLAPTDACSVSSVVAASASDACSGVLVSTNATAICPLVSTPRIVVTQTCPATPASPGGLLSYSGSISNAGNITLTNVVITNDRTGTTPVFSVAALAPGAILGFSGSYTVPTNSGCSSSSTLTGGGSDKCSGVRVTSTASATCPLLTAPRITVRQTCPTNLVAPGAVLTYTGTVSNSGNVTLTNVAVVNNLPASNTVIFTVATLAPGAIANFTGSYQVPSNCCVVSSTVVATGRDNCTGVAVGDTFTATCTVLTVPKIVVTKVCPPTATRTGDLLQYSGVVSNAGNITLVNVTIVNSQSGSSSPVLGPITLAPRESVVYYAGYVVPSDFCGTDTVVAQGLDVCNLAPATHSVTTTCSIITTPRITVTKNCPPTPAPRGGLLIYTGSVSNAGNVTLINVFVTNNQPSNNAPVIGPITLAPGATTNFSGSYIAPSCCCYVVDTLSARGQDRCSGSNVTATATAVCPLASSPGITVTKVCPQTPVPVGGLFTYSGSVSNTGDVVLTNVFVVSSQPNANTLVLGPIELAPREMKVFSGSYPVTTNSNPATDIVTARGTDTCQARTVIASANCFGLLAVPTITSVEIANGMATVTWTAEPGTVYALQYKTNIHDPNWINVPGNVTGSGNTASKNDVVGVTKQRVYRIVILP